MTLLTLLTFSFTILLVALLVALNIGAIWFYGHAIYAAIDCFSHWDGTINPQFHPPVTILKLLSRADEPDAAAANLDLVALCQQDYPQYQIIFVALQAADPGVEQVKQLMQQFPALDLQLVIADQVGVEPFPSLPQAITQSITQSTGQSTAQQQAPLPNASPAHPSTHPLTYAAAQARYDLWLVLPGSVQVGQDYLRQVVQPFRYPGVGVVSCPYRTQVQGWRTRFAALTAATELHPQMLVARKQYLGFTAGQPLLLRKAVIDSLGGMNAIAADLTGLSHSGLNQRLSKLATVGYRGCLSHYIVGSRAASPVSPDQDASVAHPWGTWGNWVSHSSALSLGLFLGLWLITGELNGIWLVLLTSTWVMRLGMISLISMGWLQDRSTQRYWWLLPVWDLLRLGQDCGRWFSKGWSQGVRGAWQLSPSVKAPLQDLNPEVLTTELLATELQEAYIPVLEKI